MSGYSNQKLYSTDFIGASSATRFDDCNTKAGNAGPIATRNCGLSPVSNGPGNLLPSHPMRGMVSTMSSTSIAQPQSLLYDISSFDPLQAQALQLSASAGLTTADILAAAAAPAMVSGAEGTAADAKNNVNSTSTPTAGIGVCITQPLPSYSQSLTQTQAPAHGTATGITGTPVSISGGHLQPIQPVPSTTQVNPAQHPYIFIQPQQIAPNSVVSTAASAFNASPVTAASNTLLVPTTTATLPPGAAPHPSSTAAASLAVSTQAQAAAVAAAAAGLGTHPLLFNPAFLTAAAAQGVSCLNAPANPGQVLQPHRSHPPANTHTQVQHHHAHVASTNALGPTLILPATINSHQTIPQSHAQSEKRSLGSGVAPSVVSSANTPVMESSKRQRVGGQSRKVNNAEEASKAEDPAEKRRYERNLREQQRSSKISSQIKELREVLSDCNVPFKPNKYSILLKVVEYIKQLQSRAIMLDAEHQKLITTVRQTNEMITNAAKNNNIMSSTTCGATDNESSDTTCHDAWQQVDRMNAQPCRGGRGDSELCFVKGIDYRTVFEQCPTAFGIAALDGRILECNVEFQNLLGYSAREDLLKQSLFNLVHNHQDIFRAMAQMLKTAEEPPSKSTTTNATSSVYALNGTNENSMDRFWTGPVTSKQNLELSMNITLTSGDNGTPKFFTCALTNTFV